MASIKVKRVPKRLHARSHKPAVLLKHHRMYRYVIYCIAYLAIGAGGKEGAVAQPVVGSVSNR